MAQTQTQTSPGPDGESQPAVSARILKKRETDRKCQRMIRERTKTRIAYLEGLVEQFRQQDASGRVETLMKQLNDLKDERDTLAKQVKNIESIISGTKPKEEPDVKDHALVPKATVTQAHITALPSSPFDEAVSPETEQPTYVIHNKEYQAYVESSSRSSWSSSAIQTASKSTCECSNDQSAVDPSRGFNKWLFANETLSTWFKWPAQALDMTKYLPYNDDVPVRAIVEGWDAVERHGHMHPAWRLLRGIDQTIFGTCEPRERLAILTVMGLLLQAHINPTTEQHRKLPAFYLKRPSQDMLHSYATEYFAWPGLRERFIFSEHRYCSNIFWRLFCQNLRLQWPYEFRDCYVRNIDTGLYRISPTFHERLNDIRCWTMGMGMFKQYPELYGDIPAWNHIPASIGPIVHMPNSARRSLPSTSVVEASQKHNQQHRDQQPVQEQVVAVQETHQPSPQQAFQHYPTSSASGSFDAVTPISPYDFPSSAVMTSMAELQHMTPTHAWSFNGNLDMYQMNTA